jgi:hypothetical protein
MRYRKLRITWTAICVIACVLLICLWVRSYRWDDAATGALSGCFLDIGSCTGDVRFALITQYSGTVPIRRHSQTVTPDPFGTDPFQSEKIPDYVHNRLGVHWSKFDNGGKARISYWWPTLMAAALAAVPWTRFSLRALLIAITAVAVVLGAIVCAVR